MNRRALTLIVVLGTVTTLSPAKERKPKGRSLERYLASLPTTSVATVDATRGSLWQNSCDLCDLNSDHNARKIGDLVIVQISERILVESSSSVASQRKLEADSGISALAGKINTAGIENLFSPHSNQALQGQGQTSSKSLLQTSITGRIVAIRGDSLVVEAERSLSMNNERQTVILRGVARVSDVSKDNTIMSTQLGNLEVEVAGKGIISDSTRPPNIIVRWLFKLLGF